MGKPDGRKGSKHEPSEEVSVIFAVEPTGPQLLKSKMGWDVFQTLCSSCHAACITFHMTAISMQPVAGEKVPAEHSTCKCQK